MPSSELFFDPRLVLEFPNTDHFQFCLVSIPGAALRQMFLSSWYGRKFIPTNIIIRTRFGHKLLFQINQVYPVAQAVIITYILGIDFFSNKWSMFVHSLLILFNLFIDILVQNINSSNYHVINPVANIFLVSLKNPNKDIPWCFLCRLNKLHLVAL